MTFSMAATRLWFAVSAAVFLGTFSLSYCETVSEAIAKNGCDTSVIKGLSQELVNWTNCMKPGLFTDIKSLRNAALGSAAAAVPYLQHQAFTHLQKAIDQRGVKMTINSALRTLPQQVMLYTWFQRGKCGITAAAKPGTSNHEGGTAVDIQDADAWISAMQANQWKKLGSFDPPHYDYIGSGSVDITTLHVQAFQKLWNANNPTKKIAEDGIYGPNTEAAVLASPVGGFNKAKPC